MESESGRCKAMGAFQQLVLWLVVLGVGSLHGQEPGGIRRASGELQIPVADNQVRSSLDRAANFLDQQQFEEAVDLLVRLTETSGDALTTRAGSPGWIPVRLRCQQMLCELVAKSDAGRAAYRRQTDSLARQWLDQGRRDLDAAPLRRVVNDLLATSVGDDALLLLGELAWQLQQPSLARHYWERISPQLTAPTTTAAWMKSEMGRPLWQIAERATTDAQWQDLRERLIASSPSGRAICSDSDIPLEDVRARLVLASLLENHPRRAMAELALLERLHPLAQGELGGARRPLTPFLRQMADSDGAKDAMATASIGEWEWPLGQDDWPMLGQATDRNGRGLRDVEIGQVVWSTECEPVVAPQERLFRQLSRPGEAHDILSYHVAISEGTVAIVEPFRIRALNLVDGEPRFGQGTGEIWRAENWRREQPVFPTVPHAGVARFGGAIYGRKLLTRLGPVVTTSANPDHVRGSELAAMDLSRQGRLLPAFPIKCLPDHPDDDPDGWCFEYTPPIADQGHVYALVRWNDGVRTTLSVDCYDISTGTRRWRTRLCGGRSWAQRVQTADDPVWEELTGNALTLADGALYICSSMGVVSAVDAANGQNLWTTPYRLTAPEPRTRHGHAARDAPCLVAGDLVIAAPQDSMSLWAFDRFDGRLIWSTSPELTKDIVHLLGADHETLVASGDRLHWISLDEGQVKCRFPEGGIGGGSRAAPHPRGAGRGLITGRTVLWPSTSELYRFATTPVLQDGRWTPVGRGAPMDLKLRGISGGNLSLSENRLIIAGPHQVSALEAY